MSKRVTEIEQQMAHLEWLKAQNERAYRNTLTKTRVMHQNDIILKMSVDHNSERAEWMTSVIKDELSKPLVLSDAEILHARKKREGDNVKITKVCSDLPPVSLFCSDLSLSLFSREQNII
jgi:disulfide oxidoreductase YuzD